MSLYAREKSGLNDTGVKGFVSNEAKKLRLDPDKAGVQRDYRTDHSAGSSLWVSNLGSPTRW